MRDPDTVAAVVERTLDRFGALHHAVNNAGITGPHGVLLEDLSIAYGNDVIATDLSGVFFGLKYELPAIMRNGGGSILNMSSANGGWAWPASAPILPPSTASSACPDRPPWNMPARACG